MRKIVLFVSFILFSLGLSAQQVDSVEVVDPVDLDTLTPAQVLSDSAVLVLKAAYDFYQIDPSFFLQYFDTLSLSGTILSASLQNDNNAAATVDLSSLQDGTGTDDQTIDVFELSGNELRLSLEDDGQATQTVDLSSLSGGGGTDDQTVDTLSLSGTTLTLALEDDGEAPYTVDLAGLQDGTGTDNQTVDTFSLSGNTLTLALEDDGESPYTVDLSSISGGGSTEGDTITLLVIGNSIAHNTTDTSRQGLNYRFNQRAYVYDYRRDSIGWLVTDSTFNGGAPLNFPPQLIGQPDGQGVDRVGTNLTYGGEVIFNYLDANKQDYVYAVATGRGGKSLEDSLLNFTYYTDSIFAHLSEAKTANSTFGYYDYIILGGYPSEGENLESVVLAFKDSLEALGYADYGTTWFMNDAPTSYTDGKHNSQLYEIIANNGQFMTAYGYQDSTAAEYDGVHPKVEEIIEYGKSAYKAIFEGRGNQQFAETNWKLNSGQDLSSSAYDGWVLTIDSVANEVELVAPELTFSNPDLTITGGNTVDLSALSGSYTADFTKLRDTLTNAVTTATETNVTWQNRDFSNGTGVTDFTFNSDTITVNYTGYFEFNYSVEFDYTSSRYNDYKLKVVKSGSGTQQREDGFGPFPSSTGEWAMSLEGVLPVTSGDKFIFTYEVNIGAGTMNQDGANTTLYLEKRE